MSINKQSRMGAPRVAMVSMCGAVALVLGLGAGTAVAGQKYDYPVYVSTSSYASGAMGSARNSTDSSQAIGCSVSGWTYNGASYSAVSCNAVDSTGRSAYCYTSNNPTLAAAVAGISSDSYVYFQWDNTGACTYIEGESWSLFAPKQP